MWTFVSMCPLNLIPFYYFQDYVKSVIFCFRGPLSSACKCFLQSPIFEILCWLYLFPLLPYFCSPTNLTFSQNSCLEWLTSLPHPHLPLKRVLLKSFLSSYSKANECFFHCHLNLSEAFNSKTTPSFLENSPVLASIESYSQVSPCLPDPSLDSFLLPVAPWLMPALVLDNYQIYQWGERSRVCRALLCWGAGGVRVCGGTAFPVLAPMTGWFIEAQKFSLAWTWESWNLKVIKSGSFRPNKD